MQNLISHTALAALQSKLADTLSLNVSAFKCSLLVRQGAINRHWFVRAVCDGQKRSYILRSEADPRFPAELSNSAEQQIEWIALGIKAGLPTARCLFYTLIDGRSYSLLDYLEGESDPDVLAALDVGGLRRACSAVLPGLAKLHAMQPPASFDRQRLYQAERARAFLREQADLRTHLDELSKLAPGSALHGDFRLANFIVQYDRANILDFDFARSGHPAEDLGWLTAPCWTYSHNQSEAFSPSWMLEAYASAGGESIDLATLIKGQIQAQLLWLDIALLQLERFNVRSKSQRDDYFSRHPQQEPFQALKDAARLADTL